MTIEDSKLIEWLVSALLGLASLAIGAGAWLARNKLDKLDNLEKFTGKLSKVVITRKEFIQLQERQREIEAENTALRMSLQDGKLYRVKKQGDMGWVIVEVEKHESE